MLIVHSRLTMARQASRIASPFIRPFASHAPSQVAYESTTLSNGLVVRTHARAVPSDIHAVAIHSRAASSLEDPRTSGFSHLISREVVQDPPLSALRSSLHLTRRHRTSHLICRPGETSSSLSHLHQLMSRRTYPRVLLSALSSLAWHDPPTSLETASDLAFKASFGPKNLGRSLRGGRNRGCIGVKGLGRGLGRWKAQHERAHNLVVTGVGMSHSSLLQMVSSSGFLDMPQVADNIERTTLSDRNSFVAGKDIVEQRLEPGDDHVHICLSFEGLGENDPDLPILQVIASLLGGGSDVIPGGPGRGRSSRFWNSVILLNRAVRYCKASHEACDQEVGLFTIHLTLLPGSKATTIASALQLVLHQLRAITLSNSYIPPTFRRPTSLLLSALSQLSLLPPPPSETPGGLLSASEISRTAAGWEGDWLRARESPSAWEHSEDLLWQRNGEQRLQVVRNLTLGELERVGQRVFGQGKCSVVGRGIGVTDGLGGVEELLEGFELGDG